MTSRSTTDATSWQPSAHASAIVAGHEVWFHSVTGDEQVIAIFDYIESMVRADRYLPPPPTLAAQVFDVFTREAVTSS